MGRRTSAPLSARVETSDTLIYSFKKLKNGKAEIKQLFKKKKKRAMLIVSEPAKDPRQRGLCHCEATPAPPTMSSSRSFKANYSFTSFQCFSPNSANPSPVPRCKPPRVFQPVPKQANSTPICRTRLPPLDRRGVGETSPRVGREQLGPVARGSLPKG